MVISILSSTQGRQPLKAESLYVKITHRQSRSETEKPPVGVEAGKGSGCHRISQDLLEMYDSLSEI